MLELRDIETRRTEIVNARAAFAKQLEGLERDAGTVRNRIANIDGALELIAMFQKDIAAKKAEEQSAKAQAAAQRAEAKAAAAEQRRQKKAGTQTAPQVPATTDQALPDHALPKVA